MRSKFLFVAAIFVTFLFALLIWARVPAWKRSAEVVTTADVAYAKRDGSPQNLTSLDIYAPKDAKSAPVMIMIHGGGWAIGDKSNRGLVNNKVPFFSQNGFIFVSINYRLSPAVKHPAHIEDVAEAVAWVHNNIGKYGGDRNKIFVMGHSAGAHLAALVATDERRLKVFQKDLSSIKGVILLDGAGYDIPPQMKGLEIFGGLLDKWYKDAFTTDEAIQKDASPLYHVEKGKNIPPFLIFTAGGRLASVAQSKKLLDALKKAGVDAETIDEPDKNHGGINNDFGLPNEMITKKSKEFLDRILKN